MRESKQEIWARPMDDNLDIGSTVTLLIKEHGQDAVDEAERHIVQMSEDGDQEGFQFWISVKRAVLEYLAN